MLVKIRKDGSIMRVFPLTAKLRRLLHNALTFTHRKYLATARERMSAGGAAVKLEDVECYELRKYDDVQQLVTMAGYERRVTRVLKKRGYEVDSQEIRGLGRESAFKPCWDNVKHVIFKEKQKELLEKMLASERGQVWYPTGAGKTFLAQIYCQVLPKARILYTTKHQANLKDTYKILRGALPSVGIYCSEKKKNEGARVMCVSSGSLHRYYDTKWDVIIGDEIHELATDTYLSKLAMFRFSRFLGLSANFEDRMDQADFQLEGLFGPLVAKLTYQEGVDAGLIVPIEVHWRTARFKYNPAEDYDGVMMRKFGLWTNLGRNRKIARDAMNFPDDQVLIVVKTVEHALHLKQLLPDYKLCYSQITDKKLKSFKKRGLVKKNFRPLKPNERDQMKRDFENGTLKKVIATTVWNRGVNFHRLQVLIRADGGASKIDDTQIPGRLSRHCKRIKKECGVLIDYQDQFDERLERKADSRRREYRRKGWKQILPENDPLFPK